MTFNHNNTDNVVCPHCGYEYQHSWGMSDGKQDCPECDKKFELECRVKATYTTTKIEGDQE